MFIGYLRVDYYINVFNYGFVEFYFYCKFFEGNFKGYEYSRYRVYKEGYILGS